MLNGSVVKKSAKYLIMLAAAFTSGAAFPASAGSLVEGNWKLVSAEPALPRVYVDAGAIRITASLPHPVSVDDPDGTYGFTLSGACNGWSGYAEIAAGRPEFRHETMTAQVCFDERETFDKAFRRAIFSAQAIEVTQDRLFFIGEDARLVFERLP